MGGLGAPEGGLGAPEGGLGAPVGGLGAPEGGVGGSEGGFGAGIPATGLTAGGQQGGAFPAGGLAGETGELFCSIF